jgi:hypothetical protein
MSERLLPLVRPIYETQSEIAEARNSVSEDRDLQARLEHQIRFDDQIVSELQAISLTDDQIEQLENLLVEGPGPDTVPALPAPEPVTHTAAAAPPPAPVAPPPEPASHPTPVLPVPKPVTPPTPPAAQVAVPEISESQEPPPGELQKEADTEQPTVEGEEAPEKEEEEEEKEEEPPRARPLTILAAVSIGLIATVALVAYLVWDQMNSFRGADQVTELLDTANALSGDEFEAVSTTTSNLKDWFFLKSDMRWFAVPKEFADTKTLGCRVFKFKGADIGEILAKNDKEVLMFLFHPNDLGVKIRKGKWTIVDGENWVGGVTGVEDCCFVVAFKGKHSEMQEYLNKKLQK